MFIESLTLPSGLAARRVEIRAAEAAIARKLPGTVVYRSDTFERLCGTHPTVEALVQLGIVRREVIEDCESCGFGRADCLCDHPSLLTSERYIVIGRLQQLLVSLKGLDAQSYYFISFCSTDGTEHAASLHRILQSAGIDGFFSPESLGSGTPNVIAMERALKKAEVCFCMESSLYHTRPFCKIERDYLMAKGARFVRVGLCRREVLEACPPYFNNWLQHKCFVDDSGHFQAGHQLLGETLSSAIGMGERGEALRNLLLRLEFPQVKELASKCSLSSLLPTIVSETDYRTALVEAVRKDETRLASLVAELPLQFLLQ